MEDKVKQLVEYFYEACNFCDELDIYEHEEFDKEMQKMKDWVDENFELGN